MTTVWFPTPSPTGRGRLRGAAMTGLSIDGPRTVRRRGATPPRPTTRSAAPAVTAPVAAAARPAVAAHDFALEPAR